MNHCGAQPCPVTAIFAIEVLDHLLAPLMLEIDIDIGRLLAILGDEAVEQKLVLRRIDIGDAETIAYRRVGRTAAPLAQDRRIDLVAREIDNVLDGQEIARKIHLADQRQFFAQRFGHAIRHPVGIAPASSLPGLFFEIVLRFGAAGIQFFGILILQLIEAEITGVGHGARGFDRMGPWFEQMAHGLWRLQISLGITLKQIARPRHSSLMADRGHYVL